MNFSRIIASAAIVVGALTPAALADGRNPGSVLVYTVVRSGGPTANTQFWTIVSVTNSNTTPATPFGFGGTTLAHFDYLNTIFNPADPQQPLGCSRFDRVETLTPADTLSVLTSCHNATFPGGQAGYLVISAQNPAGFDIDWSHNFLMGSEIVVNASGAIYALNAIPFEAIPAAAANTDVNLNNQLDFDGVEYEGVPETLFIDSFIGLAGSQLALLNLTGGPHALAIAQIDVWNDNEFPLSTSKTFKCWFDVPLIQVSTLFDGYFLANNTPDDPDELDIDCNGINDLETGWARINGVIAFTPFGPSIPNPALLGSITAGPGTQINGGKLLWESKAKQLNGSYLSP